VSLLRKKFYIRERERERERETERDRKRERESGRSVKTSKEILKSLGNVYEGRERNFIRAPNSNNPFFLLSHKR
jgi:hypothetical protein